MIGLIIPFFQAKSSDLFKNSCSRFLFFLTKVYISNFSFLYLRVLALNFYKFL
jgi:hypothetical protein